MLEKSCALPAAGADEADPLRGLFRFGPRRSSSTSLLHSLPERDSLSALASDFALGAILGSDFCHGASDHLGTGGRSALEARLLLPGSECLLRRIRSSRSESSISAACAAAFGRSFDLLGTRASASRILPGRTPIGVDAPPLPTLFRIADRGVAGALLSLPFEDARDVCDCPRDSGDDLRGDLPFDLSFASAPPRPVGHSARLRTLPLASELTPEVPLESPLPLSLAHQFWDD